MCHCFKHDLFCVVFYSNKAFCIQSMFHSFFYECVHALMVQMMHLNFWLLQKWKMKIECASVTDFVMKGASLLHERIYERFQITLSEYISMNKLIIINSFQLLFQFKRSTKISKCDFRDSIKILCQMDDVKYDDICWKYYVTSAIFYQHL